MNTNELSTMELRALKGRCTAYKVDTLTLRNRQSERNGGYDVFNPNYAAPRAARPGDLFREADAHNAVKALIKGTEEASSQFIGAIHKKLPWW